MREGRWKFPKHGACRLCRGHWRQQNCLLLIRTVAFDEALNGVTSDPPPFAPVTRKKSACGGVQALSEKAMRLFARQRACGHFGSDSPRLDSEQSRTANDRPFAVLHLTGRRRAGARRGDLGQTSGPRRRPQYTRGSCPRRSCPTHRPRHRSPRWATLRH